MSSNPGLTCLESIADLAELRANPGYKPEMRSVVDAYVRRVLRAVPCAGIAIGLLLSGCVTRPAIPARITVHPFEDTEVVLHNPGMGWVLYENDPLHQGGSSTLATLPGEDFAGVDAVAVMFAWSDVEHQADTYDFSKVDQAYDYWHARGKEIQLRMSAESLLWWSKMNPPAGIGVPAFVLAKLPADAKQTRLAEGFEYLVVDARESYYRERLAKFLQAVNRHFDATRPVTLIDLRGFGLWGEWHQGFRYPTLLARHDALTGIIDLWSSALPGHKLALSASYDPDSPPELRDGPTDRYDEAFTASYDEFLYYSAFDHALKNPQITFRRDGAGGAVHSKERKLMNEAFAIGRCPFVSEFVGGYADAKSAGQDRVAEMVDDALSLHPNYVNLLGWAAGDALAFMKDQPALFDRALRTMGYRLMPTSVTYPAHLRVGRRGAIEMTWVNRGVGHVCGTQRMELLLIDAAGNATVQQSCDAFPSNEWVKGQTYAWKTSIDVKVPAGEYRLCIRLIDQRTQHAAQLPIAGGKAGTYEIGPIRIDR